MVDRLEVVESNGTVEFRYHGKEITRFGSQQFVSPIGTTELEDLRWYLEDYLTAPYAVWEDRGQAIAQRMPDYGSRLFKSLFVDPAVSRSLASARKHGEYELWFCSEDAVFLSLPWELMFAAGERHSIVFEASGINRTTRIGVEDDTVLAPRLSKRVLMVIARPSRQHDAAYRAVARPLLETLEELESEVTIQLVRPPTFAAFVRVLKSANERGDPYDVVHFDGHGNIVDTQQGASGYLCFEAEAGGPHWVKTSKFASALADSNVAVCVLNACRSGMLVEGQKPEVAVAPRLASDGALAVVAMSYSIYVRAAAAFMATFYGALFGGDTVLQAVTAGRNELRRRNLRPSPKGDLPLSDWCVPVAYGTRTVRFAHPQGESNLVAAWPARSMKTTTSPVTATNYQGASVTEPSSRSPFVGRDGAFFAIENTLGRTPITLIHGMAGCGKTAFAKAYAQWLIQTGWAEPSRPFVFVDLSESTAPADIHAIIRTLAGALHQPGVSDAQLRTKVTNLLRQGRFVVVLDHIDRMRMRLDAAETCATFSKGAGKGIADYLNELRLEKAKCCVLITSRSDEPWLGEINRIELSSGLLPDEAIEYIDNLGADKPHLARRREARSFGELLERAGGHPAFLRYLMKELECGEAEDLLSILYGAAPRKTVGFDGDASASILEPLVCDALDQLDEKTVDALRVLTPFRDVVDATVLGLFREVDGCPVAYQWKDPRELATPLFAARSVGLLTELNPGLFRVHPALPSVLVNRWRFRAGNDFELERGALESIFVGAFSHFCAVVMQRKMQSKQAGFFLTRFAQQIPSLLNALECALKEKRYDHAQQHLQALDKFFTMRGRYAELEHWIDRAILATADANGEPLNVEGTPVKMLWKWAAARREQLAQGSATAIALAHEREERAASGSTSISLEGEFALYHNAGRKAQAFGALADAQQCYVRALHCAEQLTSKSNLGTVLSDLGRIALSRGSMEEAERYFRHSLDIYQSLSDQTAICNAYLQLGIVARKRGDMINALDSLATAEALAQELRYSVCLAAVEHNLGIVHRTLKQFDDAERCFRKALDYDGVRNNVSGLGMTYHQLGILAQMRVGDCSLSDRKHGYVEAVQWYEKSLETARELGDRHGMGVAYGQLANLCEARGDLDAALSNLVHCTASLWRPSSALGEQAVRHLGAYTARMGMSKIEERWLSELGERLPESLGARLAGNG